MLRLKAAIHWWPFFVPSLADAVPMRFISRFHICTIAGILAVALGSSGCGDKKTGHGPPPSDDPSAKTDRDSKKASGLSELLNVGTGNHQGAWIRPRFRDVAAAAGCTSST